MAMLKIILWLTLIVTIASQVLPTCKLGYYMDPSSLQCTSCPINSSMVTSADGFGCTCDDHSVSVDVARCKRCNSTEMLSGDGTACVPRRCQKDAAGRLACRKCPADYIPATNNLDGSPLKEVQCIKCARGYQAIDGRCAKCEACTCSRKEVVIRGVCVPKNFVQARPKNENNRMHPNSLLDIVKFEYLCTAGDVRACRTLANKCVRSLYDTEPGGPCRLWLQSASSPVPKGLPELTLDTTVAEGLYFGEIRLPQGQDTLRLMLVAHAVNGGMRLIGDSSSKSCLLPQSIKIGSDFFRQCYFNLTEILTMDADENLSPYIYFDGNFQSVPVTIRKPNGNLVQRGKWRFGNFRQYFLIDDLVSLVDNTTSTVALKTLVIQLRLRRDSSRSGKLLIQTSMEAQYGTLSKHTVSTKISLKVEHELPSAGVLRALEIWGGVLGALSALYAVVQWRGACRRGSLSVSLAPILAGYISDALYCASLMASFHALASEASSSGLSLPLSVTEECTIEAFLYSALALKTLRVLWLNWCQCRCDVFVLDWDEYNPPLKGPEVKDNTNNWRTSILAREWLLLQTDRRANPAFTAVSALIILQVMEPWQAGLPSSRGYICAVGAIAWWCAYTIVTICQWIYGRLFGIPSRQLLRSCRALDVSLLVFQEEFYAHYVHGRIDDAEDLRSLSGALATCRVVCTPQLRLIYKQLSTPGLGSLVDNTGRRTLLTRFLAAFFERALDGLSWVASERTLAERLFDVELTVRESGTISTLLYDPEPSTPSVLALTWWGEECNLAVFDAVLFSCTLLWIGDTLLATLVVLIVWQVMMFLRNVFGRRNFRVKTEINESCF